MAKSKTKFDPKDWRNWRDYPQESLTAIVGKCETHIHQLLSGKTEPNESEVNDLEDQIDAWMEAIDTDGITAKMTVAEFLESRAEE
ncbi:hypothetical protein [Planctomyces sp. SH-PL14]|uniref:hypothetical protein n=1 Tax=Planctomyces sp. SH-PL14 TaxID=1632864 RepID=UPI00078D9ACB|nr:hypothetical protein [Planctomyces sp. SH-PL14]AMV21506.1 hypothetical protein VT03_26625 [Planctomyces sp. SH-PL14]